MPKFEFIGYDGRRARVLVVEDNDETLLLLRHLLAGVYDVELASGVTEAKDRANKSRFDLLIIDINLGETLTGTDVLKYIRSLSDHINVPALALTAYALPGDEEHYLASGFDAYLSKPFAKRELLQITRALLFRDSPLSSSSNASEVS